MVMGLGMTLALLAIAVFAIRRSRVAPRPRNHRLQSDTSGVPREIIDYDAPRRFARGSVPPPMSAQPANVVYGVARPSRPALRLATPSPLDDRWDLSD